MEERKKKSNKDIWKAGKKERGKGPQPSDPKQASRAYKLTAKIEPIEMADNDDSEQTDRDGKLFEQGLIASEVEMRFDLPSHRRIDAKAIKQIVIGSDNFTGRG